MPVARSHLYVPGDRAELIAKAPSRGADALILDLEDAVHPAHKAAARDIVVGALSDGSLAGTEVWVRVHSPGVDRGAQLASDLDAIVVSGLHGIVVAKAETPDELAEVVATITHLADERQIALRPRLAALVESALGLVNIEALARVPGVSRIGLGEADLRAALGIVPGEDEAELLPLRLRAVLAAAAAGLDPPVGPVSTDIADLDRLRRSTDRLRRLGFVGRSVIHPAQIPVVHEIFTPSTEALAEAEQLVAAMDEAASTGSGVFVDARGQMVDEAVVRSARRLLELRRES